MAEVEPALASTPRVHRLATPPILGEASTVPVPLAVWIEETTDRGGEVTSQSGSRTLASLDKGSVRPVHVSADDLAAGFRDHRAEYLLLLRCGDEVSPLALERLGQAARLAPDAHVFTCDEDHLTQDGERVKPTVRPGPSPDRWLACDDSGSMLLVSRDRASAAIGALSAGRSWRHELALQLAGGEGRGHAHVPMFLCHRSHRNSEPEPLAPGVVTRAMHGFGQGGEAELSPLGHRRIRRPLQGEPAVEAIVCFRDKPELLSRCVHSLLAVSSYEHLSLALVDNGSVDPATAELLSGLATNPRIRVLREDRPFNFAGLNNVAASTSAADVLLFLNNDTEAVEPDWLTALLSEAVREEVGAVAPLLLYPSGTVQHAGAALGLHGYAGHPFAGLSPQTVTPFGMARQGTRNWLAVTAACLMVERRKFESVGGFDESFVVAGNDVDLCLRLTAAGHRSLCVSDSVLVHDESQSRGAHIDPGDFVASERSYGDFRTVGDPFYSPNLTLSRTDCGIRDPEGLTA